jgi:hypothetical protein
LLTLSRSVFFLALKKNLNKQSNRTPIHAGTESHRTRITSVFYRTTPFNIMLSVQPRSVETFPTTLSSYSKFRMALKSREVQRQYPNLLEKILDFCKFEGLDAEQKSLEFFRFAKNKSQDEVEDIIIRFVSFQKVRIDRHEITAGTLRNYVKAIKLFCRMNRINISWDTIARYLPKVKHPN